ncbi:23S rRNA (uracil(1939)-C(5))-methyltransferase RlmD [bacterium]|nr:23S rRNA (uracil(1939)-C(5))-methyltransferase RlmD [bacterium]
MIRELDIKKAVYRGFGLAYLYGRPVFVLHAFPGEKIRARIRRKGKKVFRGELIEVLEGAHPHRIQPDCPFSGICGGCHYQELFYETQLALKRDIILENLRYIGKLENIPEITLNPSPQQFRYRPQCGFAVKPDPERWRLGYYRYESQVFLEIQDCLLLIEPILFLKKQLEDFITLHRDDLYGLDYIDIRMNSQGQDTVMTFGFRDLMPIKQEAIFEQACATFQDLKGLLFRAWKTEQLWGSGEIFETVLGRTYCIGAGSFFQNNRFQWEPLQRLVSQALELAPNEKLLDLFCGIGFWSIGLSRPDCSIQGYECNQRSVDYARMNARRNGCFQAEFETRDLSQGLGSLPFIPDKIIINPPRSGCSKKLLNEIAALGARTILYISCDPPSLARDIARLIRKGNLAVRSVDMIDMFPQTYSIETAVVLTPV